MPDSQTVHIFHIERYDGSALFLHPFRADQSMLHTLENCRVEGHYGAEPDVSSLTEFRNELYGLAEHAVRSWDAETRFIPRFVISSALFVVSFLFLSIVVRDPVPVLDELLISLVVGIGSYLVQRSRGRSSERVERKRMAMRTSIDTIVFSESAIVYLLEETLHMYEAEDDALQVLLSGRRAPFAESQSESANEVLGYLSQRFGDREFRRRERRIMRGEQHAAEQVKRWAEHKKVDLALFCFYLRLKRALGSPKVHR
ncbi:MAG: hypothetical protein EA384_03685 [Spirochaetaceae bacterium]|nr:MAG: hypothetical protein EA384_03685 [Spirochaetaceae bacterium]